MTVKVAILFLALLALAIEVVRLRKLVYRDELTGLYNRRTVPMFGMARPVVVFLDLDGFKKINDRYGHVIGDRYLQKTARILQQSVRRVDRVARWGGDEFIILTDNLNSAWMIKSRVERKLAHVGISATFGVGYQRGKGFVAALKEADTNMYHNKCNWFDPEPTA